MVAFDHVDGKDMEYMFSMLVDVSSPMMRRAYCRLRYETLGALEGFCEMLKEEVRAINRLGICVIARVTALFCSREGSPTVENSVVVYAHAGGVG